MKARFVESCFRGFPQAGIPLAKALVVAEEFPMAVGFMTCPQVGGSAIALTVANTVFGKPCRTQINVFSCCSGCGGGPGGGRGGWM